MKELQKSQKEIEAWNRELQNRVDAKTQQLADAQEQLVQSSRLSALGRLGAPARPALATLSTIGVPPNRSERGCGRG